MRGIVGLVVGLGIVLVGVLGFSGCKEKSATYCCTGDAMECPTRVECTGDPARTFCDMVGRNGGEKRTCIADPEAPDGGGACETSEDCADPGTSVCVDHACVQCQDESTCPLSAPVCEPTHACGDCAAEADCTRFGDTPHCGADGACVACRVGVADDCDVDSALPVCGDIDDKCRGCLADVECPSALCDENSGKCVKQDDIIFVDSEDPGGAGCGTQAAPCRTINEGLLHVGGTRIWIQVAPRNDYAERLIIDGKDVNIVAPGASLQPGGGSIPSVLVTAEATVSIEGLRIFGGSGTDAADGVRCAIGVASSPPVVRLRGVTIEQNAGQGIDASSCTIDAQGATIRGNTKEGISVVGSTLTLERSRIESNIGGGVNLVSSDFSLVNNFIVRNGALGSNFGGVFVNGTPPSAAAGARFEFNTVSGNDAANTVPSGVRCSVTSTVSFKNNIVYANEPGTAVGQVDILNCNWSFSDIGPGITAVPGTGNKDIDPAFLNPANGQFHLKKSSEVQNVAEDLSPVVVDFDGETRPQSGGWDMGADEVMPE